MNITTETRLVRTFTEFASGVPSTGRSGYLVPAAGLVVLVLAGAVAVARPWAKTEADAATVQMPRLLAVQVMEPEWVSGFEERRSWSGQVVAARAVELGFERAGRIKEVMAEAGQRVKQGQTIAKLDTRALDASGTELQARRNQAQARLDEMVSGPTPEVVASANAAVQELETRLGYLKRRAERAQRLGQKGSLSIEQVDEAVSALREMEAKVEAARKRRDEKCAAARPEALRAQRALISEIDAKIASLRVQKANCALVAPFDAVVAERYLDGGAVVAPGQAVLRLLDASRVEARIGVSRSVAASCSVGQRVDLMWGSTPVGAEITAVLPEFDPATRSRTVVVRTLERPRGLISGERVRLELAQTVPGRGFWLPRAAVLRTATGAWACLEIERDDEHDRVVVRELRVLKAESRRLLVAASINPGTLLVATGVHRLAPGQRVLVARTGNAGTEG